MSSIASTLNSINSSLLNEIQSISPVTRSNDTAKVAQTGGSTDRIDFSQAANLFKQLQQLQSSNPAELKQVLTDAVAKLKDAANQQTDPRAAQFFNNLADRFQKAADTGDLSSLHPQSGTGRAHGHHGPPPPPAGNDGDGDDQTGSASVYGSQGNQDPLSSFLSSGSTAGQGGITLQQLVAAISGNEKTSPLGSQIQNLLAGFISNVSGL